MKALLLADANRLSASPSEYEANRHRIERAEYKTFTLRESDFHDLVFMEAKWHCLGEQSEVGRPLNA